jgi:4-aminobutyrate aminotransferase / (S)-3-amino-2-methylpropionate transaminase / 5-aminovalerate transaminase
VDEIGLSFRNTGSMPESLPPDLLVPPPGPRSLELWERMRRVAAPMGPKAAHAPGRAGLVLERGQGSNLFCADGNRYVDLAAGFGAMLLGHNHPSLSQALTEQAAKLSQALGDVYPSDIKISLLETLAKLHPAPSAQVILGQSGADALTAALKTALLHTGRPGVLAFSGSYHGLSYAPLSITDLRPSYRTSFDAHLSQHTHFLPFPRDAIEADETLKVAHGLLGQVGAVVFESVQGRAGVWPAPPGFLAQLCAAATAHGALSIADEVWTGLGRAGAWVTSLTEEATPDLICLGKGLGGGQPISACIGACHVMQSWSQDEEVVHTSTFAGAPLACRAAVDTLLVLENEGLVERSRVVGQNFLSELEKALGRFFGARVRGRGMMVGIDVADFPGQGRGLQQKLLERGYLTTTGGGQRNVLVLTPALNTPESLLSDFVGVLRDELANLS